MSITPERKQEVIKEYAQAGGDTGSPEVQVAILSERIQNVSQHLQTHQKDCLLYTSPSPRDLSTSRMPSSA